MRRMKTFFLYIFVTIIVVLFSACVIPEDYDIFINIDKNGQYIYEFDGIITILGMRANEIKTGNVSKKDESDLKELIKKAEEKGEGNAEIIKMEYIGHSQLRVISKEEGVLSKRKQKLIGDLLEIVQLDNNQVMIKGMDYSKKDIDELNQLDIVPEGKITVKTNAKVIDHNADSKPGWFGLKDSYKWNMESKPNEGIRMLIQLETKVKK